MSITFYLSEISVVADNIWKQFKQKKIWAFIAPMGAGKTTFIHALCTAAGVRSNVSSPTFAIINEYESKLAGIIYHMDWYRLKNEEEAIQAGCEDCINSGNICFIEWPEKAKNLLPKDALYISLEIKNEHERTLCINTSAN